MAARTTGRLQSRRVKPARSAATAKEPAGAGEAGETGHPGRTADDGLAQLGLTAGEAVRWQRRSGGHWQRGTVIRREADGSIAVHDGDGAWRSIPMNRLEVLRPGKRPSASRAAWEPVAERAERASQLRLW